jgi:hypothetical protein
LRFEPCSINSLEEVFTLRARTGCPAAYVTLLSLGGLFNISNIHEGLLGQVVPFAFADLATTVDGLGGCDVFSVQAGELFGDGKGLREEAFESPSACNDGLVGGAEFVNAEDGNDVLEVVVSLEVFQDFLGDVVVFLADDVRVRGR